MRIEEFYCRAALWKRGAREEAEGSERKQRGARSRGERGAEESSGREERARERSLSRGVAFPRVLRL